jgi:hypothetical protein
LVNTRESLTFERLWQIKASAADREGKTTISPVVCRVVGAYRHIAGNLPVLGAASVAVKVAGGGALDSLTVHLRPTSGERVEWAPILRPDDAARLVVRQLATLMGQSKIPFTELARPERMEFGYLSLGKRTSQRVLAPHYIATISIDGHVAQGYQLVVPATERIFEPLAVAGHQPPMAMAQRARPMVPRYAMDEQRAPERELAPAYHG